MIVVWSRFEQNLFTEIADALTDFLLMNKLSVFVASFSTHLSHILLLSDVLACVELACSSVASIAQISHVC